MPFKLSRRRRDPRINLKNRDPHQIFNDAADDDDIVDPLPTKPRPSLIGKTDPAAPIAEPEPTVPATMPAQRELEPTYTPYDLDAAELEDRSRANKSNPYLKNKNSKVKSMFLGMLRGGGQAAEAALRGGNRNPLAAALGGALGGGVTGAVHDSWDEEEGNERRKAELRDNMGFELTRREKEADVGYKQARPALEMKKLKNERVIEAARQRLARDVEAGRMTRAQAQLEMERIKQEETKRHNQATEETARTNAEKEKDLKLPDTFYRGKDKEQIKNAAIAEVLSKPEYHQRYVRPELLQQFGTVDKLMQAVRADQISLNEVYADPSKGPMLERDLAATSSRLAKDADEYDAFLDMTSKSPQAQRITVGDFENVYAKFKQDLAGAKDEKVRRKLRAQFEQALSSVRLVGE